MKERLHKRIHACVCTSLCRPLHVYIRIWMYVRMCVCVHLYMHADLIMIVRVCPSRRVCQQTGDHPSTCRSLRHFCAFASSISIVRSRQMCVFVRRPAFAQATRAYLHPSVIVPTLGSSGQCGAMSRGCVTSRGCLCMSTQPTVGPSGEVSSTRLSVLTRLGTCCVGSVLNRFSWSRVGGSARGHPKHWSRVAWNSCPRKERRAFGSPPLAAIGGNPLVQWRFGARPWFRPRV